MALIKGQHCSNIEPYIYGVPQETRTTVLAWLWIGFNWAIGWERVWSRHSKTRGTTFIYIRVPDVALAVNVTSYKRCDTKLSRCKKVVRASTGYVLC